MYDTLRGFSHLHMSEFDFRAFFQPLKLIFVASNLKEKQSDEAPCFKHIHACPLIVGGIYEC